MSKKQKGKIRKNYERKAAAEEKKKTALQKEKKRQKEPEKQKIPIQKKTQEAKLEKKIIGRTAKFNKCYRMLSEAQEAFAKNDMPKARELYIEARNLYINLEYEEKKEIYGELMDLYKKLLI